MAGKDETTGEQSGIEIPSDRLDPDLLRAVIEEFVLREGTDYGLQEFNLDEKVAAVRRQLDRKQAVLLFDPETETCTIVPARAVRARDSEK